MSTVDHLIKMCHDGHSTDCEILSHRRIRHGASVHMCESVQAYAPMCVPAYLFVIQ